MDRLQDLIKQLNELNVPTARVEALKKAFQDAGDNVERQNAALQNMQSVVQNIREAADFAGESFRDLTQILQRNNKELDGKVDFMKKAMKSAKVVADVSRQMMFDEEEITSYSEKQLANKIERAKKAKEDMSLQAENLINENSINTLGRDGVELQGAALAQRLKSLVLQGKITAEEASLVQQYKEGFKEYQGVINRAKDHLATQKRVNETLGVTGALTKGLAGALGKLGIEGSALQHSIEDANVAMKKAAKEGAGTLKTGLIGIGHVAKGVAKTLSDPVFVLGFGFKAALEGADHINEVERALGLTTEKSAKLVKGLEAQARASGDAFINTTRLTHAVVALSDEMGIFATSADPTNLEGFARLTENLGYSKDAAASLIATLELHGQTMDDFEGAIDSTVNQFNRATKSNVTMKAVMDDVVGASAALKVTLGDTPEGLIEAATAARGLGLSLSQVEKISESLLDFQSSIDSEMEAQLMTGKALNLAKAREAALMGDQKTVAEEIGKQQAVQEAFATKNVLAQNAVAKSLGLSRDELAVMYKQQQLTTLGAEKFAEVYDDQTLAQIEARNAADAFADTMGKLKDAAMQAFLPLGEALLGITRTLANLVSMPGVQTFVKYFVPAALGAMLLAKSINGVSSAVKGISSAVDIVKSGFKGLTNMIGGFGKAATAAAETTADVVSNTTEAATTAAQTASQGASGMTEPKTSGSKIKEFLTNLAAGLKEMGSTKVLGGALNLIPASLGFIAFIPGMVGVKLAEKIDGEKLRAGLTGLADGLKAMSKSLMGSLALGAAALAFTAMIPATAGMLLFNLVAPATSKILPQFGQALVQFGTLMMSGVGLLGLASLGAAAIALGFALGLAAPAIESAGTAIGAILTGLTPIIKVVGETIIGVFQSIPGIIQAVANGFVNMFSAISMDNIVPILLLGPALLGASAGILAFSGALAGGSILSGVSSLFGGGIMSDLESLAAMSEPLAGVGMSLTAIATGIAALSAALTTLEIEKIDELKDLVMTTAFAAPAIAATGAITELISGITGASTEGGSDKALLEKIDRLIAAVESGGDVYIDGNKAGRAINLATYKSA